MKNLLIAAALSVAAISTPTFAADFDGPRVEVTAGADDVLGGVDTTDITYGGTVGFDKQFGRFVIGAEANLDNVFNRRDFGVSVRAGFVPTENVLIYTKAGYSNWRQVQGLTREGLRVGGGLEVNLGGPFYAGIEGRYSDFESNQGKYGAVTKIGIRF